MNHDDAGSSRSPKKLDDVIAACLRACESGIPVDREALLSRHPEFAEHLRAFFAAQDHDTQSASYTEQETAETVVASEEETLPLSGAGEESTHGQADCANADPYATTP